MSGRPGWADDVEPLPEATTDDTPAGWGERDPEDDDHLIRERPPHWD